MIEKSRIPHLFIGENYARIRFKLKICVRAHSEMSKAILNDERDYIPFRGMNRLCSVDNVRFIINNESIMLKLPRQMDGGLLSNKAYW